MTIKNFRSSKLKEANDMAKMQKVVSRVRISLLNVHPDHTKIYGIVTEKEVSEMALLFDQYGQSDPIRINPRLPDDPSQFFIEAGVIRFLAAKKLYEQGNLEWEFMDAIIAPPSNCPFIVQLIMRNKPRHKTRQHIINEVLSLGELIPDAQGVHKRSFPGTDEIITGKKTEIISAITSLGVTNVGLILEVNKLERENENFAKLGLLTASLPSGKPMPFDRIKVLMDEWINDKKLKEEALKIKEGVSEAIVYTEPKIDTKEHLTNVTIPVPMPGPRIPTTEPPKIIEIQSPSTLEVPLPPDKPAAKIVLTEPVIEYENFKAYLGSCANMPQLLDETIQMIFTSPPYWQMFNYFNSNLITIYDLGLEPAVEQYIFNLTLLFGAECKRVLKKKGHLMVNLGDTRKAGSLAAVFERFVCAMLKQGWYLVGRYYWHTNRLPNGRAGEKLIALQMNTEMIYHFTKSPLTDDFNYKEYRIYNEKERKLVPKPTQRNLDGSRSKEGFILTNDYDRFDDNWYKDEVVGEFKDIIERQDVLNVIRGGNGGKRAKEIRELNLGIEHPALMPNYLPVLPILSFTEKK